MGTDSPDRHLTHPRSDRISRSRAPLRRAFAGPPSGSAAVRASRRVTEGGHQFMYMPEFWQRAHGSAAATALTSQGPPYTSVPAAAPRRSAYPSSGGRSATCPTRATTCSPVVARSGMERWARSDGHVEGACHRTRRRQDAAPHTRYVTSSALGRRTRPPSTSFATNDGPTSAEAETTYRPGTAPAPPRPPVTAPRARRKTRPAALVSRRPHAL
jgi:hypothetical protein